MSLRLITPPTEYPVTQAEAKMQCRVDGSDENSLIDTYIAAATAHVESVTGRAIMDQTWELVQDDFSDAIMLPKGPVQSITSVSYYDTSEVLQTVSASDYVLDNVSDPAWLVAAEDFDWPEVADGVNNVIIRFVAGYDPDSNAYKELRAAILLLVAHFYDNRSTGTFPDAVQSLLTNHRSFAF
jgi:uncharacterized phiE125 gp8 family phage protein